MSLNAAMDKAKQADPFFGEFILKDMVYINKKYADTEVLTARCTRVYTDLTKPAELANLKCKEIMRVVEARCKPDANPKAKKKAKIAKK